MAAGIGLSSFVDGTGEHAFYVGSDSHVHQLYWNNSTWVDQDLTAATAAPPVAPGIRLSSFADSMGEHAFYVGSDSHVHQLYWSGP